MCLNTAAPGELREREGIFGSLVIFVLSESQRRSFDSLCPRQLLPVISFTKGLLPRTPVNQQKLYIQRKLKPFSGSQGTSQEGATKRFQLLLSPAAAASALQGPPSSPTACAHRCCEPSRTSSVAVQQDFCITAVSRLKLQCPYFKGKYGQLEAMKTNLRTSSRRSGTLAEQRTGWNRSLRQGGF